AVGASLGAGRGVGVSSSTIATTRAEITTMATVSRRANRRRRRTRAEGRAGAFGCGADIAVQPRTRMPSGRSERPAGSRSTRIDYPRAGGVRTGLHARHGSALFETIPAL